MTTTTTTTTSTAMTTTIDVVNTFATRAAAIVDAVERSLVAEATKRPTSRPRAVVATELGLTDAATEPAHAAALTLCTQAALYTVAARFLAVGTPRSIGIMARGSSGTALDTDGVPLAVVAAVAAIRVYFPTSQGATLCFALASAEATAAAVQRFGGDIARDPMAADLVCHFDAPASADALRNARRGAHHNLPSTVAADGQVITCDRSWLTASVTMAGQWSAGVATSTSLPRMAAGLDDGRQLDEVSVFASAST